MQRYTLGQFYGLGFCVGDADLLVKHGKATLGQKSGKLIINMNLEEVDAFMDGFKRKW